MNTPFQDTKINSQNLQLYQQTPEEELTRNVFPEAQQQIISNKRNPYRSQSPDKSPKSSNNLNSFLLPYGKHSKSQANIMMSTKQGFLPSISNNLSGSIPTDVKGRQMTVGENFFQKQSFVSQFPSTTKINEQQYEYLNDRNPRAKNIFSEDRMEQDRNVKLGFLKNKYEKTMKNTFCLRNKSRQMRSMREIMSNSNSKQESPEKKNFNNNKSSYFNSEQGRNLLGIFLQKKKDNAGSGNFATVGGDPKVVSSPLISTYKYDKIYKMFIEQQQKQALKEQQNNKDLPSQFNCNTDKPKMKKSIRSDFMIKTKGVYTELIDSINTRRSVESEFSNQISPIQQQSYMSYEQQPYIQSQKPNKQKFFSSNFRNKQDYISFLNNPLSLKGQTMSSNNNTDQNNEFQSQILSKSNQANNIFSNNAIQKIFINPKSLPPQKLSSFMSDKYSNGSQKDSSLEEHQLNLSQDLMKKSSFSINMQQSSNQIHKPFGSMTQSSFKKNPSMASEQFKQTLNQGEESDENYAKPHLRTKSQVDDINNNYFSREGLISEEEEAYSPLLNIHSTLQNLNELNLNNADEVVQSKVISLQKINRNDSQRKEKTRKQVDFQEKMKHHRQSKTQKQIISNSELNSDNEGQFNGFSVANFKSETGQEEGSSDHLQEANIRLLNQPSIALRTEDIESGLLNEQISDEGEDGKVHEFVLKKSIDFAQLKELRDKTINRLTSTKQLSNIRQASNSLNQKTGSQNKFHPLVSPLKSNPKFEFTSSSTIHPLSDRNNEKEKEATSTTTNKKVNNLKKYFSQAGKKKRRGKKQAQEQQNSEEKQKEQDIKIAEKLNNLKDKLRMSVKVVIREQIQAKIQSTLSQQILSGLQNNINNEFTENQEEEDDDEKHFFENPKEIAKIADDYEEVIQKQSEKLQRKQTMGQNKLHKATSNASPQSSRDNSNRNSFHSKQNSIDKQQHQKTSSLHIQVNENNSKKNSVHSSTSPKSDVAGLLSPQQKGIGLSKYSNNTNSNGNLNSNSPNSNFNLNQQNSNNQQKVTPLTSPNKKPQNPSYENQQKQVQEYSAAIMSFFNACVDNMKDNTTFISHEFQLKNLKNFNEKFSQNLVNTFTKEMKNQKMSNEEVERFKYIYEINTKMHLFYKGIVQLLGGVQKLKELVEMIIKKISSHITLLPVNHVFSPEQMHRRIIPGICALLCDDHKLFYQTLQVFTSMNSQDEFSFIDFYFIKKYIYSFLSKQKKNEISQQLCLLIMQKIESVRRFIFPISVLADSNLREQVAEKLFLNDKFLELFCPQFELKHLKNLINHLYDYFYYDGEDGSVLDFIQVRKHIEPFIEGRISRKIFDYIEHFTQKALQEDPFTLNVVLRDLHYKFAKVRLRFGFNQGVFGIIKFNKIPELMEAIDEEIKNAIQYNLLAELNEKEQQQVKETSFLSKYLKFLLCEYDIFSVYDISVAMSYLGVTLKIFKFWINCLYTVMLTKYNLQPAKVQIFIRFVEACCPTS